MMTRAPIRKCIGVINWLWERNRHVPCASRDPMCTSYTCWQNNFILFSVGTLSSIPTSCLSIYHFNNLWHLRTTTSHPSLPATNVSRMCLRVLHGFATAEKLFAWKIYSYTFNYTWIVVHQKTSSNLPEMEMNLRFGIGIAQFHTRIDKSTDDIITILFMHVLAIHIGDDIVQSRFTRHGMAWIRVRIAERLCIYSRDAYVQVH